MIARGPHARAEVRPFGSSLRSPHHPFGTVPPLSNRGCYVPQGRTSAPCSQRLLQRLHTLLAAAVFPVGVFSGDRAHFWRFLLPVFGFSGDREHLAGEEVFPLSVKTGQQEQWRACLRGVLQCFFFLLTFISISCKGPQSYEEFVRAEDAAGGVYEFVIPSSTTCDLSFYTAPLDEPLQLEITLDSLKETVWFPAGQHKALYRSGIRLTGAEASTHVAVVLRVRPVNPPEDFRGLGIIIKRNDGTR